MNTQNLFNHMSGIHGLTLLESELFDIVNAVRKDEIEAGIDAGFPATVSPEAAMTAEEMFESEVDLIEGGYGIGKETSIRLLHDYARSVAQQVLKAASQAKSGTSIMSIDVEQFLR